MSEYKYLYYKGDEMYYNKRFTEALNYFTKAFSIEKNYDCANYIGCCHLQLGDLDKARDMFENIIRQTAIDEIEWARPFIGLAQVCIKKGNYDEALNYLEKAKAIDSNGADLYFYYGILYKSQKRYQDAIKANLQSLEIDEKQHDVYLNLSDCYYHINEYNKALQCCEKAMENSDYANDARYNKGRILIALRRYAEAKQEFLKINVSNEKMLKEIQEDIAYCTKHIHD